MFSVEHTFDATVVTLVDEGDDGAPDGSALGEDVVISFFEDCVTLTQLDPRSGEPVTVTLSMTQARDLTAALNLPEGVYRRE